MKASRVVVLLLLGTLVLGAAVVAYAEGKTPAQPKQAPGAGRIKQALGRLGKSGARTKNPDAIAQRIADMAGVTKDKVLSLKTGTNTWADVMDQLKLTFRRVHDYTVKQRDAQMAKRLAALTGKTEQELLAAKAGAATWKTALEKLGVNLDNLKQQIRDKAKQQVRDRIKNKPK